MTPLDRLLAESEIGRLILNFAAHNDAAEWPALAALFTPDAHFTRPTGGDALVGRDAILAAFASRPPRKTRHLVSNIVVDLVSDDEAIASCALLLFAAPIGENAAASPALVGGYRDRLVRTTEGWRFMERVGFLDFKVDYK